VRAARAVLAEAHTVLGDDVKVPADVKADLVADRKPPVVDETEQTIRVTDVEETIRIRASDVPKPKPGAKPAAAKPAAKPAPKAAPKPAPRASGAQKATGE